MEENEIEIDGERYVRKENIGQLATEDMAGKRYVIARTYSAGVFAGYLKSRNGKDAILINAIRLWYWDGAATLSQLAMEGTKKPEKCKFACKVNEVLLTETIELLCCTQRAKNSIERTPTWKV
ncbi:MAG: DUF6948 domain-containing protein [Methanosarcinales archaeon]